MIKDFKGKYSFLSNFYQAVVTLKGVAFLTVEHAYQAHKAVSNKDFDYIRGLSTPGRAKRAGRSTRFTLRSNWEDVKDDLMLACVRSKFSDNKGLGEKLLKTGNEELIEGNIWHDNIWGDCSCSKCRNIVGENRLGMILMQVRDELKVIK